MEKKFKNNMKSRKTCKNEIGITLIALVVTIVVLLILAGVSLSLVLGENGLINKAKEARDKYAEAAKNDEIALNEVSGWLENSIGENSGENPGGGTQELPSTGETKPYLPGEDFSKVPGTDLDNGLVIEDKDGNQYVWIEVPKKAEVYPTAGLNITGFTSTEYKKIENDLKTYSNDYRENGYVDTYYGGSTMAENGWFKSEEEYNKLKQEMLKSVYSNGGFWIGRYEAGIEKNRTEGEQALVTPVSKANQYPYNYVTILEAHILAQQINKGICTSSLMFGVQWDLVLKFIEVKELAKGKENITTIQSALSSNSTKWGNYNNNISYKIKDKEKAKQSINEGKNWNTAQEKTTSESRLFTTGASEDFNKMNIYDLAGNVYEWTYEKSDNSHYICSRRGGVFFESGLDRPAMHHFYGDVWGDSSSDNGFRVTLF